MTCFDRSVLANIRGCEDTSDTGSPLRGACCTNQCELFKTCKIKREPLLIHTINMQGDFDRIKSSRRLSFQLKEFPVWHSGHADYVRFQPDSEINGRFDEEFISASMDASNRVFSGKSYRREYIRLFESSAIVGAR